MSNDPMILEKPLVVLFRHDENTVCHLWPEPDDTHEIYGILVADLIRHIALHFDVDRGDVLDWVKRELAAPTADITRVS